MVPFCIVDECICVGEISDMDHGGFLSGGVNAWLKK